MSNYDLPGESPSPIIFRTLIECLTHLLLVSRLASILRGV